MTRARLVAAGLAVLLLTAGVDAQQPTYRFADPLVLVGPGSSIGVRVRDLTAADAATAKLDSPAGVFVQSVEPGTPADRAGIKSGDVIVEFDGERVRSVRGFTRLVSETPPQRTVKAVVLRAGSRRTLDVTPSGSRGLDDLVRASPAFPLRIQPRQLGTLRYREYIGVTLDTVGGQMADFLGVAAGVLVSAVDPESPASRAGLKAGDVITAAAGQDVRRPEDVREAVRRTRPDSTLELKIVRDHKEMTIGVSVPSAVPMLL